MVDALHEAHAALRPGGSLIDLRPDASREPRLVAEGRVRGRLAGSNESKGDDFAADDAIRSVVGAGMFRSVARGGFWHATTFGSLSELDAYVRTARRFDRYARGSRAALVPYRGGPIVLRRALKFEIFARVP